jgi:hypothetical protein
MDDELKRKGVEGVTRKERVGVEKMRAVAVASLCSPDCQAGVCEGCQVAERAHACEKARLGHQRPCS